MTRLDWAKANRAEMPKVARQKTETQKRQEAVAKAYANGTSREQERIINLIEKHGIDQNNRPYFLDLINLIKEGNK